MDESRFSLSVITLKPIADYNSDSATYLTSGTKPTGEDYE